MYAYSSRVFGGNTVKNEISRISRISDEDLHWYAHARNDRERSRVDTRIRRLEKDQLARPVACEKKRARERKRVIAKEKGISAISPHAPL